MIFKPYYFQELALNDITSFFASGEKRRLYASPTGTGKSVIELMALDQLHDLWLITPRVEIIAGMLTKLDHDITTMSQARMLDVALDNRITTPLRLRNALLEGRIAPPSRIMLDEGHHDNAETYQQIHLMCGDIPAVALTATPFRGTPKDTQKLYERWGEPIWIITYPEAVEQGYITMPDISISPMVDDDVIDIQNGEFIINEVNSLYSTKLQDVLRLIQPFYDGSNYEAPIMTSVPSTALGYQLQRLLLENNYPCEFITQETSYSDRQDIFKWVVDRKTCLLQINVVSEGVDLPLRIGIDLAPIVSPVKWLQMFGRFTRPGGKAKYICTNRNILRHCYLLEGCIPNSTVKESLEAFGGLGKRPGMRAIGMEAMGRLKPTSFKLRDGMEGQLYVCSTLDEGFVRNYAAIVLPHKEMPIWATKRDSVDDGQRIYGKWSQCEPPTDLAGFASVTPSQVTEKQANWWAKSAKSAGLGPQQKLDRKVFSILPIVTQARIKLC